MKEKKLQPWVHSASLDTAILILPSFIAVAAVWIFRTTLDGTTGIPLWAWVGFILCIDVSHVYSTIFRTYFNAIEFAENRSLLIIIPLLAWLSGVLLYSINALLFWRVLAYVAVFHFIRQQYGFMMLYSRNESDRIRKYKWIDKSLIYLSTLYPIVYWHTHLPRNFHWFVDGDFFQALPKPVEWVALTGYIVFALLYLMKELYFFKLTHTFSLPKQLIILGTALSWYVGIVALNGDMAFTITNVVSHGIPYIGLIWIFGLNQKKTNPDLPVILRIRFRHVFSIPFFPIFIGMLLLFAYMEEGLWAGFVWREHLNFFYSFSYFPKIFDHATLTWVIPLLSLPQVTHYILDGFIWRLRDQNASWQKTVFHGNAQTTRI